MNPDLNPCSPGLYNAPTPWDLNPSPSRGIGSTNILSPNHNSPLRATVSSSSSSSSSAPPPPTAYPTKESRRQPPPPQILLVPPQILLVPPSPPYRSITALATATALPTTPPITGNVSSIGVNPLSNRVPSAPTSPVQARSMGPEPGIPTKKEMKQRYAFTRRCKLEPHFNTKFPVLVHQLHLG